MRIAEKKPLQKITVRDIVDDCGINRNTFYYYFRDIYEVAEAVFSYPSEFPAVPPEAKKKLRSAAVLRAAAVLYGSPPRTHLQPLPLGRL